MPYEHLSERAQHGEQSATSGGDLGEVATGHEVFAVPVPSAHGGAQGGGPQRGMRNP
jgi:hypothetical protein